MSKKKKTALSKAITRGRVAAGSLTKLIDAMGAPKLNLRTAQDWEQGRRHPPEYVEANVIERIEKYLSGG